MIRNRRRTSPPEPQRFIDEAEEARVQGPIFYLQQSKIFETFLKDYTKTLPITDIYKFLTCESPIDQYLRSLGTFFGMICGAIIPCLGLVFGQMVDTLIDITKKGFMNSTFHQEWSINAPSNNSSFNTREEIEERVTIEEFFHEMYTYTNYYFLIGIFTFLASYFQTLCSETACERTLFRTRSICLGQTLRQDITWFDNHLSKLKLISSEIEKMREGIGINYSMVAQYISTVVSATVVGLYADWRLTFTLLFLMPFVVGAGTKLKMLDCASECRDRLTYARGEKAAKEILYSIRTIAAFGGQQKELKRYGDAVEIGRRVAMKDYHYYIKGIFFLPFFVYFGYGLGFWSGCYNINVGYSTPGSVFTVFFSILMGAYTMGNIQTFFHAISNAVKAGQEMYCVVYRVPKIDPYAVQGIIPIEIRGRIVFETVCFTYSTREAQNSQVLNRINLDVKPGQTVAIVGSTGAGKSTIINLLMRFYDPTSGQVLIDGNNLRKYNLKWVRSKIGLVSQEPVLFNVSVLENIKYGGENVSMEEVKASALLANAHSFIEQLPQGYDTIVGEGGYQLSRSQKMLITIARAVVKQPQILLVDEATSALDAESEGLVQKALENVSSGRTTIIVAQRLSTIRNAHVIYFMKKGKIVESGNHDTLMTLRQKYFHLFTVQYEEEEEKSMLGEVQPKESTERGSAETGTSPKTFKTEEDCEIFQLEDKKGFVTGRILKLNSPEWMIILVGLLMCAISGTVHSLFALYYGEIFGAFSMKKEDMVIRKWLWTPMFILLGVVIGAASWFSTLKLTTATECLLSRVRYLAMENILKQEVSWFDYSNFSVRKILDRLSYDVPMMKEVATRIGHVVNAVTGIIGVVIITNVYGPKLASLVMLTTPFIAIAAYLQVSLYKKNASQDLSLMKHADKIALEAMNNMKTVQALGREFEVTKLYMEHLLIRFRRNKKQTLWFSLFYGISRAVLYYMYSVVFYWSSFFIASNDMSPGDVLKVFFAFSLTAYGIGQSLASLKDYAKVVTSCKLVFQLMDKKSEENPLDTSGLKPAMKGRIKFNDVCFSYPTRKNIPVLNNFNLEIRAGEMVALVGESGCGKSTILSLLERFYNLNNGEILIDGVDIRNINLSYLRSNIGLVTPELVLFPGSIKTNILYGINSEESSVHEELISVAKMVNIHNFISHLKEGYDTICGLPSSTKIPDGQKQRIAIARALTRDPKILLVDEVTLALDPENEKNFHDALDKARKGRTTIIAAQRISTMLMADKIVVIQKGRVVEEGKHSELKERRGVYYQLFVRR